MYNLFDQMHFPEGGKTNLQNLIVQNKIRFERLEPAISVDYYCIFYDASETVEISPRAKIICLQFYSI